MSHPDMHVSDGSNKTPLAMSLDAMVSRLDALVSIQGDTQRDVAAQLDLLKNFGSPAQRQAATDAQKHTLHGGANPTAGMPNSLTDDENPGGPVPSQATPDMGGVSYGTPYQSVRAQAATALGNRILGTPQGAHRGSSTLGGIAGGPGAHQASTAGLGGHGTAGIAGMALGGTRAGLAGYAAQNVQALGQAVIQSGGSPTALMGNISQVPVVAQGAGAIGWFMNQRDKGYRYQEIEGGSNLEGQRERFHEEVYSRFSPGWSSGEARQAFQDVTMMGLNRRAAGNTAVGRQEMLEFMYHNKTTLGMTGSESAQFGAQQLQTATPHLRSLSEALRELSNSAGQAGVNVKLVREQLRQNIQGNMATGMGGYAANVTAQGQGLFATWGNAYTSINTQAQNSSQMQYRFASQAGMSRGEWARTQRNDPVGAQAIKDKNAKQHLDALITPAMRDWIKNAAQQVIDATGELTNTDKDRIARDFIDGPGVQLNPEVMVQIINSQGGVSVDFETWPRYVVDTYLGNTQARALEREVGSNGMVVDGKYVTGALAGETAQGPNAGKSISDIGKIQGQGSLAAVIDQGGKGFTGRSVNVLKALPSSLGAVGLDLIGMGDKDGGLVGTGNKAAEKYAAWSERNGGAREGVIDALLTNVKDPNKQKVQVTVKGENGQEEKRIVSLATAIDKFHNQVVRGDIKFMNEEYEGKSFEDVVGVTGDKTRDAEASKSKAGNEKLGQSWKDYEKEQDHGAGWNPFDGRKGWGSSMWKRFRNEHDKDEKSDFGGKLDLTPEAKKLLRLLPGETGRAAAEGAPPDPSAAVEGR